jgi:hypothetical protein
MKSSQLRFTILLFARSCVLRFGQIMSTDSSPPSIFGSGLGADASPRLIQLQAKFTF